MYGMCSKCGEGHEDPMRVSARYRVDVAQCQECSQVFCAECLREMAIEHGLLTESAADSIESQNDDASAFLVKCEESGLFMCPNCFENREEDEDDDEQAAQAEEAL